MAKLQKIVLGGNNPQSSERLAKYYNVPAGTLIGYMFYCPGCESPHPFYTAQYKIGGNTAWGFDGNEESPSFTPSLIVGRGGPTCCHLFCKQGQLEFLPDSKHKLAGQTVPLPEYPEGW